MYKTGIHRYRQMEKTSKESEMRRSFAVKTMPNRPFSVSSSSTEKSNSVVDVPSSHRSSNGSDTHQNPMTISRRIQLTVDAASAREAEKKNDLRQGLEKLKKHSHETSNLEKISRRTIQKKAAKEQKSISKSSSNVADLQKIKSNRMDFNIPRTPFVRLIKQILLKFGYNSVTHISSEAVKAIQLAAEVYLTNMFEDLHILALHGQRVTIMPRDFQTLMRLSSKSDKVMMDLLTERNLHRVTQSQSAEERD